MRHLGAGAVHVAQDGAQRAEGPDGAICTGLPDCRTPSQEESKQVLEETWPQIKNLIKTLNHRPRTLHAFQANRENCVRLYVRQSNC